MPKNKHTDNEAAFKDIVVTHQDKVINTCYRFVQNREEAEDLAQEVFIQVFKSLGRFREESGLSTWIYRIAVNKALDHIRKLKRKKRFGRLLSIAGLGGDEEAVELPAGPDPQRVIEDAERREILQAALNDLPENQRAAITLSKYEEFSNPEIAGILNTSVSAVESLIHRAKENLRKKLRKYYEKRI